VKAQGSDAKGRGAANAVSSFRLEPAGSGSKVLVHTNLTLSGAVAQYGRGVGMVQSTAAQLMKQFADNLKAELAVAPSAAAQTAAAAGTTPQAGPPPAARPISGFALMWKVLWETILRLFRGSRGAG
jgi:hypothetical protein